MTPAFEKRVRQLEARLGAAVPLIIRRELVKESTLIAEGLDGRCKLERVWIASIGIMLTGYGRTLKEAFESLEGKAKSWRPE